MIQFHLLLENWYLFSKSHLSDFSHLQGVQPGPLRGPVGALPRNPMVQCGFEKIAGLGVDWNLEYDMCTHEYLVNQASQVAACT
jgi:hypothetical protein